MNTLHKALSRVATLSLLLAVFGLLGVTPVAAQFRSRAASVRLTATLPGSVTVQHQAVPLPQSFREGEAPGFEVVHVFLQWNLPPGMSVQLEPWLEEEREARPLLAISGFVGLRELALASHLSAFQPPRGKSARLLGAFTDGQEKPAGRASLLVGATAKDSAQLRTIRVAIAIL